MTVAELRGHRPECVCSRLKKLQNENYVVHLLPKDPDPYPDFKISNVTGAEVTFKKLSSDTSLAIELQKIANITPQLERKVADVQLRGRVVWDGNRAGWFLMSRAAALLRQNL